MSNLVRHIEMGWSVRLNVVHCGIKERARKSMALEMLFLKTWVLLELTMNVIDWETGAWRNVKTTTDSIHFHITVDLTALREGMLEFIHGFIILTLFNLSRIRWSPLFSSIGLPYILAGIATSVKKWNFMKCGFNRFHLLNRKRKDTLKYLEWISVFRVRLKKI